MPQQPSGPALLASDQKLTWVFTGDSITHGLFHTQGRRSYPEHLTEFLRGDLYRVGDAVLNTGISGNRIGDILDDWGRRVADWSPDVVSLMIGTNDANDEPDRFCEPGQFADDVTRFVDQAHELGAVVLLATPPWLDVEHCPERARIAEFAEAVRQVAASTDAVLVDQWTAFVQAGRTSAPWGFMNDRMHPNAAGHALLARTIISTLGVEPAGSRVIADLDGQIAAATLW